MRARTRGNRGNVGREVGAKECNASSAAEIVVVVADAVDIDRYKL